MKVQQQIRGSSAAEAARVLSPGALSVNTDNWRVTAHDGVTPGGHPVALEEDLVESHAREFLSEVTYSVPGALPNTIQGKFGTFTVAGNYTLPLLADITMVGAGIWIQATVAGVILDRNTTDLISDLGSDVTSLNLVQNQVVRLVKKTAARWVVLSRY